jgi:hypothetical protein
MGGERVAIVTGAGCGVNRATAGSFVRGDGSIPRPASSIDIPQLISQQSS